MTGMTKEEALSAVERFGRAERYAGIKDGLRVAEQIVGYLSRQPDRKWQREARDWAMAAIRDAYEKAARED